MNGMLGIPRKEAQGFACKMQKQQFNDLMEMAKETGLRKTTLTEKAIETFYRFYKAMGRT